MEQVGGERGCVDASPNPSPAGWAGWRGARGLGRAQAAGPREHAEGRRSPGRARAAAWGEARGRHLVAGVHGADIADVQVVQGHEQLGPQRAVVHVPRPQEERPQELQHHVIQLHVLPHHPRQRLHHLRGPAPASRRVWRHRLAHTAAAMHGGQRHGQRHAAARRHRPRPRGPPSLLWAVSAPRRHSVWSQDGEGGGVPGF